MEMPTNQHHADPCEIEETRQTWLLVVYASRWSPLVMMQDAYEDFNRQTTNRKQAVSPLLHCHDFSIEIGIIGYIIVIVGDGQRVAGIKR
jgi:hypothetical protein